MLYVIIPTFRNFNQTRSFVRDVAVGISSEFIIVDDAGTYPVWQQELGRKVHVIKGTGDLWWVGSVNLAISFLINQIRPSSDAICVIANQDVRIKATSINNLIRAAEMRPLRILHPITYDLQNNIVSSGSRVITWVPYITYHPLSFDYSFEKILLGTARFLVMKIEILIKVSQVNPRLKQYQGDNDLTMKASRLGIGTYIMRDAECQVDMRTTGLRYWNIKSLDSFLDSFKSIKSPWNTTYRYRFLRNYFGTISTGIILSFMLLNTILKFFISRMKFLVTGNR